MKSAQDQSPSNRELCFVYAVKVAIEQYQLAILNGESFPRYAKSFPEFFN